jgi:phage shock protein A
MGFLSRLAQLIKSNLNDLINKSEDPEKMLNQVIVAIADETRLYKQFGGEVKKSTDWEQKAMLAVRSGDDGLAKEALLRKKEHDAIAAQYQEQWERQKAFAEQLKTALKALNNKIGEAQRKKNVLIARKRRAEAMKSIQETMSGLTDASAFETFDRMAEQIDQMEAEAEAGAQVAEQYTGDILKHRFSELEATAGADLELEALKRKMGLLPAEPPPVSARVATSEEQYEEEELAELEEALEELKRREG